MKRTTQPLALAFLFGLAVAGLATADEPGFIPLFDGKTLAGWVQPDPATGASFAVEDGVIVGRTDGKLKKNEFLATAKPYGNFILKAKFFYKGGNSGIQFRSDREPNGRVTGPQADIADGFWGLFYEEGRRGILERFPEKEAKALYKSGEWNDFVIEARGDHVVITLNGTKVIDRTDKAFQPSGIIALQVHVGSPMEVRFKDVEIKKLD